MTPCSNELAMFQTDRFMVIQLSPSEGRMLAETLLQDEVLAAHVPWLVEKTRDDALLQAYGIERQAAAGQLKMWGIVTKGLHTQIGAIIAKNSLEGIDVEVLVLSQYHDRGVVEEAGIPVLEWLDDNAEDLLQSPPMLIH